MDTKITEIEILIDKINLLFNATKEDGILDRVEVELLKKYVSQLHEKLHLMSLPAAAKKIQDEPETFLKNPDPLPLVKGPEILDPVQEIIREQPLIKDPEPENKIPPVVKEEIKPVEDKIVNPYKEVVNPYTEIKKTPDPIPEPVVKKEENKFKLREEEDNKINSKLANNKKTLAEKIHSSKAKEITSVIDLNDKLFFIKELFKGDANGYSTVLKRINTMGSFAEVKSYIQNELTRQYDFSDEESVDRFLEVVKLKFED